MYHGKIKEKSNGRKIRDGIVGNGLISSHFKQHSFMDQSRSLILLKSTAHRFAAKGMSGT